MLGQRKDIDVATQDLNVLGERLAVRVIEFDVGHGPLGPRGVVVVDGQVVRTDGLST